MREVKVQKERLEKLYEHKKLTTYQIADELQCCQATVWKRIHKFGIKPRPAGPPRVDLDKEKLVRSYNKDKLSTWKIEQKYGYPRSTVYRKLLEYGLEPRNLAKSHIVYPRKSFSGNMIEKAYLIGFAAGDLRARTVHKNTETIHVDCGSTKSEQINLIKKLFEKYGRVWTSKQNKKGKIQIEAFLDYSFDFLLNTKREIRSWILNSDDHFASFLAGFTDAEGSFGIYKGMAVYQLGNYNQALLFLIHQKLKKLGINCPQPYEDKTKGYATKHGYIHNQNYWHLRVHRKSSLLRLFELIEPYLKHEKRMTDMKNAKENVEMRNKIFGNSIKVIK